MKPHLFGPLVAALLLVAGIGTAASASAVESAAATPLQDSALIAEGQYLTRAGNCVSCHTARDGQPFAGGRTITTPFGLIFTSNITPDVETGIGDWSFEDFWQALHDGKGRDGELLYPAFSYTSFTRVRRGDARAMFVYLQSLQPVRSPNLEPQLDFPYSMRTLLHAWRALYFEAGTYQPDPDQSEQWNRGAYLVQGLGHCNECHTDRNRFGAMDEDTPLAGGTLPGKGWFAPDLSTKPGGGLAGWSNREIADFLKTGLSDRGAALGPMAEVVRNSTQYLHDDDLEAIATYLASLPSPLTERPQAEERAASHAAGGQLYEQQCAACHGDQGEGVAGTYPSLADNTTVIEPTGINAIRAVLLGGFPPVTAGNPKPYSMPPYAGTLDDDEVAAVVNYIRQSWGNMAVSITAEDVATYRAMPTD